MKKDQLIIKSKKGFSLVEVLLASSLLGILVMTFLGAFLYGQESTALSGARSRAVMLAEEGLEATRNIRDENFSNLTEGIYGISSVSGVWDFSGTSDTVDIFTREIAIKDIDPDRKFVESRVSWKQNNQRNGLVSLITQFSNFKKSVLSVGDWTKPELGKVLNFDDNGDGIKVQTKGDYAYVIRAEDFNFLVIDVSDSSNPFLVKEIELKGKLSNLYLDGDYAYVSSGDNSNQLQIVDISNPLNPELVSSTQSPDSKNSRGVYIDGGRAYVSFGNGEDLVIFDISNPLSPYRLGGVSLSGSSYEVVVKDEYAYVSSRHNSREVQIVDVSDPSNPFYVDSLNLPDNGNAYTISFKGEYLFVGQSSDFRIIELVDPVSMNLVGSLYVEDVIYDVSLNTAGDDYVFLVGGRDDLEFMVIDISSATNPVLAGGVDTAGNSNLYGVAYSDTLDLAFGVSVRNSEEFIIFMPGI